MVKAYSFYRKGGRAKQVRVVRTLGRYNYKKGKPKPKGGMLTNRTNVRAGLGFPKRMVMTHRYCEQVSLTSTAGVLNKYQWSCNGMYDPNVQVGGHQPYYFDQMMALYNHYTVIGSKIKITVVPASSNTTATFVGVYKDDDTTTTDISDITVLAEQSQQRVRTFNVGATDPSIFTLKWSAKKTFGGSILANDNLQGNIAGNPTEQTYYTVGVQGFSAGANNSVTFLVELTYIAVWDELKTVAQS